MSTAYQSLIETTITFVKEQLANAEAGHDWWHVYRVWNLAKTIGEKEQVNMKVVELASLLHNIADAKFHDGDEQIGPVLTEKFLVDQRVEPEIIGQVVAIVRDISFKNSFGNVITRTKELDVVQDADRLDAIGAIGIARTFNYGGFKGNLMYDPDFPPRLNLTKEAYKLGTSTTVNHFYEKLLLLKDQMNTKSGKVLAEERHQFMLKFLDQFYKEWEGG